MLHRLSKYVKAHKESMYFDKQNKAFWPIVPLKDKGHRTHKAPEIHVSIFSAVSSMIRILFAALFCPR